MFHVQKWTFYMLISKLHIHVIIFLLLINGKKNEIEPDKIYKGCPKIA